ncbi:MAG: orotidine 5'-phosphate decarboxylase / HUMPS family protein [Minisyncoccia bacterium]
MSIFAQKWHTTRDAKNSVLFAGVDPAHAQMRDKNVLPDDVSTRDWCLGYIQAVAPHVAGIKCNPAYFQSQQGLQLLGELVAYARSLGLITMADIKASDIGSTNDAWFFSYAQLGFDSVTIAPYAGNIESSVADAHERNLAAFTMGLMSNPEYQTEMHFTDGAHKLFDARIRRSIEAGADGIVVGATYEKEDPSFQTLLALTKDTETLYLVPGIGAQGGTIESFFNTGIEPRRCLLNIGRALMFPDGMRSTHEAQKHAALHYKELAAGYLLGV